MCVCVYVCVCVFCFVIMLPFQRSFFFLHQRLQMVLRCSLSDTQSLQVSKTLFSILVDVKSAGLSLLVLLFPSLTIHSPILWGLFQVHQLKIVSPSPSCSIVVFYVLWQSLYIFIFFHFYHLLRESYF